MAKVKAGVEYTIHIDEKIFRLDRRKYDLLNYINTSGSITEAAKLTKVSYRTALNYISRIEKTLEINIVHTVKGGKGGGGGTTLTSEGLGILRECKKINAIMEIHRELNEIEANVVDINKSQRDMTIQMNEVSITLPLNEKYSIGDKILALISYDNIFIMLEVQESSIRNVLKGTIKEMTLKRDMIRVKVDIGGIDVFSDITLTASEDLNLHLGKEVYIGFKALSIATLKL